MGKAKADFTEQEMLGMLINFVKQSERVTIDQLHIRLLKNGKYRTIVTTTVHYPSTDKQAATITEAQE
jgi:hypothetical protein